MNTISLIGRLTKDPEIRYTNNSKPVTGFTLAVNRAYAKEGQQQADFISCVAWDKLAETIGKYCKKGRQIGVTGRLQTRNWDDTDGKKHYATEVVVENMTFADSGNKDAHPTQQEQETQPASTFTPPVIPQTMQSFTPPLATPPVQAETTFRVPWEAE